MDVTSIRWKAVCQLVLAGWVSMVGTQALALSSDSSPASSSSQGPTLFRPDERARSAAGGNGRDAQPDPGKAGSQAHFRPLRKRHITPEVVDRADGSMQPPASSYGYSPYGAYGGSAIPGGVLPYSPAPLAPYLPVPYPQAPYMPPLQTPYAPPAVLTPYAPPPIVTPYAPPPMVTPYIQPPLMMPYGWGIR